MVQVNSILTKSRNPKEHGYRLENQKGSIVHTLPHDPFVLIRFDQLKIRKKITVLKKTKWIMASLEWYIHEEDFVKINPTTP